MGDKLKTIMADVFNISEDDIHDESSPDTIENWDSMQHLNLILSLEEAFGFSLETEEVVAMTNFKSIQSVLENHVSSEARPRSIGGVIG